jgi:hypothetical protein
MSFHIVIKHSFKMFFNSLESSIEWSRSVLNARCRVCRRKGDPEKMLLCDTCNKGHHIYCLKPMLEVCIKNMLGKEN